MRVQAGPGVALRVAGLSASGSIRPAGPRVTDAFISVWSIRSLVTWKATVDLRIWTLCRPHLSWLLTALSIQSSCCGIWTQGKWHRKQAVLICHPLPRWAVIGRQMRVFLHVFLRTNLLLVLLRKYWEYLCMCVDIFTVSFFQTALHLSIFSHNLLKQFVSH